MLLYTKPHTKRIDALRMPHGYQHPKFNQFDERLTPNNTLYISLKRAVMLELKEIGWLSSSSNPLKLFLSTGTLTWSLSPSIARNKEA